MDKRSTNYRDRLRSELVAASRWLHREHQGVRAPSGALREPHRRRRFSVGNTLGIALAAGVAALLVVLGTGTQRAGAERSRWMATPTAPAEGQTAAAERACLAKTGVSRGTPPRSFSRSALAEAQSGPWHVLVADTRGRFTFVLLQSSNQEAIGSCLATSSRAYGTGKFSGFPGGKPPAAPAGQIRIEGGGGSASGLGTQSEPGHPYSFVWGKVGAGVSGVTLVLPGSQRVTPTVAKGWLLAWWPSRVRAVSAEVTTRKGTTSQQLYNRPK